MGDGIRPVNPIENANAYMKAGERSARTASEHMAGEVYGTVGRQAAADGFTASAELTAEQGLKEIAIKAGSRALAREAAAAPAEAIPGLGEVVAVGVGIVTVLDVGYEIYKYMTK